MGIYTLAYDKINGNIVAGCEGDDPGLLNTVKKDNDAVALFTGGDVNNIGILVADVESGFFSNDYMVKDGKLAQRRRIQLTTNAIDKENPNGVPEIVGDGKSTCQLTATIKRPDGKVDNTASPQIRFFTSRGRLSSRNGIAKAEKGVAQVTLTSVPETVPPFEIRAEAEGCIPGSLTMEFY